MNVKFYTAANLSNELIEAQENKKLLKIEKQLAKTEERPQKRLRGYPSI